MLLVAGALAACEPSGRSNERPTKDRSQPAAPRSSATIDGARRALDPLDAAHDELRRAALEKRGPFVRSLLGASIAWCNFPSEGVPVDLMESMTTGRVVPFVDCPSGPGSEAPRRGHWHDRAARTTYCDMDLIAWVSGSGSEFTGPATGMGLALAFADGLMAKRDRGPSADERFAIAGALVRHFIAPTREHRLPEGAALGALRLLREALAHKAAACPSDSVPMQLLDSADEQSAARAFERGFEDPKLGFFDWLQD